MLRLALLCSCVVLPTTAVSGCDSASGPAEEAHLQHGFAVVLSEISGVPIGPLSDQTVLQGQQCVLVSRLDSRGRTQGPVEPRCVSIEEPGDHVLEVSVDDEVLALPFLAVSEGEIVGIELLQPDEEDLLAGTWVHVDAVGVTKDGTHVASIHPRFSVGPDSYAGYFAYQYDPQARRQTLDVDALGRSMRTKFRGIPSEKTSLSDKPHTTQ